MKYYLFIMTLTIVFSDTMALWLVPTPTKECTDFDKNDMPVGRHEASIRCTASDGKGGTVNSCDCSSPKSSDCKRACTKYATTEELYKAIESGDIAKAEKALKAGADINNKFAPFQREAQRGTPLMAAKTNMDMIEYLIKKGADVNTILDETALTKLIKDKKNPDDATQTIPFLIMHGANVNLANGYGELPLILAIKSKNTTNIINLIKNGADIHAKDKSGKTAQQYALETFPNPSKAIRDLFQLKS